MRDPLTIYIDFARLMVERDLRIIREIKMFDEAKKLTTDINALKVQVAARIDKSRLKISNIFLDFDARVGAAEAQIQQNLDAQALEVEAVVRDLTNAGESVSTASADVVPITQKVAL